MDWDLQRRQSARGSQKCPPTCGQRAPFLAEWGNPCGTLSLEELGGRAAGRSFCDRSATGRPGATARAVEGPCARQNVYFAPTVKNRPTAPDWCQVWL